MPVFPAKDINFDRPSVARRLRPSVRGPAGAGRLIDLLEREGESRLERSASAAQRVAAPRTRGARVI
jgi:hypothetical protein